MIYSELRRTGASGRCSSALTFCVPLSWSSSDFSFLILKKSAVMIVYSEKVCI